jgi:hypothetical protein
MKLISIRMDSGKAYIERKKERKKHNSISAR